MVSSASRPARSARPASHRIHTRARRPSRSRAHVLEERPLRGMPLPRGQQLPGAEPRLMVAGPGQRTGRVVPGERLVQVGGQPARHHRGVHVDPRHVGRPVADRGIDLRAGRRTALGPLGLVPAVRPDDRAAVTGRETAQPAEQVGERGRRAEVEPGAARPASVVWTCASTNAGATNRPSRWTYSSTFPACSTPCRPIQLTRPSVTAMQVACGSAGLCTRPPLNMVTVIGSIIGQRRMLRARRADSAAGSEFFTRACGRNARIGR